MGSLSLIFGSPGGFVGCCRHLDLVRPECDNTSCPGITCLVEAVVSRDGVTVEHPQVSVVARLEAEAAGLDHGVPDHVTATRRGKDLTYRHSK